MKRFALIALLSLTLGGCPMKEAEKRYIQTGELPGGWSGNHAEDHYGKQNKDRYGFAVLALLIAGFATPGALTRRPPNGKRKA